MTSKARRAEVQTLNRIRDMAFNAPLMIEALRAEQIADYLLGRFYPEYEAQGGVEDLDRGSQFVDPPRVENGAAIINIKGTLVTKGFSTVGPRSEAITSYSAIRKAVTDAEADPRVTNIILDIDSPGGVVAGAFDAAEVIRNASKPTKAVIVSKATSAAYLLAAATDHIEASADAMLGSIGVVMIHVDQAKALADAGLKVTPIFGGSHKVALSGLVPLSDEVKAETQAGIDRAYDKFAQTIADYRGIDKQAVLDTEARVYPASETVELGLVDTISDLSQVIPDPQSKQEEPPMPEGDKTPTTDVASQRQTAMSDAAAIVAACNQQGVPFLAESLLTQGMSTQDALKAISDAGETMNICASVGKSDAAKGFIEAGKSPADVSKALLAQMANASDQAKTNAAAPDGTTGMQPNATDNNQAVYGEAKSWDAVYKRKFGNRMQEPGAQCH